MKHIFVLFTTMLVSLSLFAGTELDFYKSVPKYQKITLGGQEISITIYPNYSVTLSGSKSENNTSLTLTGTGHLYFEPSYQSLVLKINGEVSGIYRDSEDIYVTKTEYNVGSTTLNALFGSGTAKTHTTKREFDHTEYYYASGKDPFSCSINMSVNGNTYTLASTTLSVQLSGDVSKYVYFRVNNSTNYYSLGTATASATVTNDEFGSWQWNADRSKIWVKSDNMSNDSLILYRGNNGLELGFSFNNNEVSGVSSSTTTDNTTLAVLKIYFEDKSSFDLPFEYNATSKEYKNMVYNRFTEQKNYDASSTIAQISSKQTLMVTYKIGSSSYCSIFSLEGLETILSYLQ